VVYVRGSGFACNPGVTGGGLTVQFRPSGFATPLIQAVTVYFRSDSLLVVTVPPGLTHGQLYDVLVTNPDGKTTFVSGGFTVS
jgi:hypothetical protein